MIAPKVRFPKDYKFQKFSQLSQIMVQIAPPLKLYVRTPILVKFALYDTRLFVSNINTTTVVPKTLDTSQIIF